MGMTNTCSFDNERVKFIREISYINDGEYLIKMQSTNGEYISSLCRVSMVDEDEVSTNRIINFDSDEFNQEIMMGFINAKLLCKLIGNFHDLILITD
ncbi:hypothetical protein [Budvicia aquatica]|uniref:Uncharacterized protein n=1 Tax=Budvicia aquatica TaxID=82979 RepID=A0A2C6DQ24_9GAMM|nr:hypothetical protein [Budvicia aquatica]PHI30901.1 hypothetical protein CRN84_16930 [Budvicia aquatica]VFS50807.1 Uncharacterised protein [Budvicia aquatica]